MLQSGDTPTSTAADHSLGQASIKLPDLLKLMFDNNLYANDTDTDKQNFLERLVQHQAGTYDLASGATTLAADQMVTRFTHDLWKLGQGGGLTVNDQDPGNPDAHFLSDALISFAMQFYYSDTANVLDPAKELFSNDGLSGGIRFDIKDVAASLDEAKGYSQYFKTYLEQYYTTVTPDGLGGSTVSVSPEKDYILAVLPQLSDWYVQAATSGMTAADTLNRGAFMLGGIGSDTLTGGDEIDLLVGNAGVDTLEGGKGNDTLIGGAGLDFYIWNTGDGNDRIIDEDKQGVIVINDGAQDLYATGAFAETAPGSNIWKSLDGKITVTHNSPWKIVTGDGSEILLGDDWQDGDFGIHLIEIPAEPATLLPGTASPNYLEAASGGQRVEGLTGADIILGSGASGTDHLIGGDGADWIVGNGGTDHIEGGLGDDTLSGIDGNSQVYGGDGNDLLTAAVAEGVQLLNIGNIPGLTADILWADAQSGFDRSTGLVYDDNGNLDLAHGSVPLAPYGGASALGGGWTFSMAFSGSTWSITYTHPTLAPGGKTPTGTWEHFIVPVGLTEGVFLFGEAGDDLIIGNDGADTLDGGSGADQLFGHAGDDVIDGGSENDILAGGDGRDILLGGDHNDELYGEQQDDVLVGGSGDDVLWGIRSLRRRHAGITRFANRINRKIVGLTAPTPKVV